MKTSFRSSKPRTISAATAHLLSLTIACAAAVGSVLVAAAMSRSATGDELIAVAISALSAALLGSAIVVVATRHEGTDSLDEALRPTMPATDPLTGLMAEESLELVVATLAATGVPYSVAICDVDGLNDYNTAHGRTVGNHALRFMAEVLDSTFRPSDVIARAGGDEFIAVLAGVSAVETAAACERVSEALMLRLYDRTNIPHFRASFGVADTTGEPGFAVTCEAARMALQHAKARGQGRVAVSGEEIVLSSHTGGI